MPGGRRASYGVKRMTKARKPKLMQKIGTPLMSKPRPLGFKGRRR